MIVSGPVSRAEIMPFRARARPKRTVNDRERCGSLWIPRRDRGNICPVHSKRLDQRSRVVEWANVLA